MFKISRKNRSIESDNLRDLIYWDKYKTIPFVKKLTFNVDVSGALTGSHVEPHGMSFTPFCKARMQTVGVLSGSGGIRLSTPIDTFLNAPFVNNPTCLDGATPFTPTIFDEKYTLVISRHNVTIEWEVTGLIPSVNDGYIQNEYLRQCEVWVTGFPLGTKFDSNLYKG